MKYFKSILLTIFVFLLFIPRGNADVISNEKQDLNIYMFYSQLCSTCQEEEEWLEEYVRSSDNINIIKYEVTRNKDNANLLQNIREHLNNSDLTTPYTVMGTMGITGFNETVKKQIEEAINKYQNEEYVDIVNRTINNLDIPYEIDYPTGQYKLPILGEINPKNVSLPLISIVIGFIDGFNPCAMWVLLFLISMLFNMKNRRRMWIIGLTFLIASAITYLGFMLAWLQVAINLTSIGWIRFIIGAIALLGGGINLGSYYKGLKKDSGCEVVDDKKRKSIFKKIKKIISHVDEEAVGFWKNKWSFILALIGIIGLAVSVNIIELACSSGLPLIFTQILAINNLNNTQYFIYILIYILFFLIDDIVVFVIAMKTLSLKGISTKYSKYSHLIGGIIMLLIGLLMIIKPEWLMFKF